MTTQTQLATPRAGEPAPDFELNNTEMEMVRLKDYAGKPVILVFFPAAFSGICTAELCQFRDNMAQLNNAGAQVLGISVDLPYSLKQFAEAQGLQFPLLSDFDGEVIAQYGVGFSDFHGFRRPVARRSVFVIDGSGTVTYTWLSDNPGQEPPYDEVLAAVDS